MSIKIEMPKLSDTMEEGTLLRWLKKEGDTVEMGDVIAEIETDKSVMEMEVFEDGTITKLLVGEGDKVNVGTAILELDGDGSDSADAKPAESTKDSKDTKPKTSSDKADKKKTKASDAEDAKAQSDTKADKSDESSKKADKAPVSADADTDASAASDKRVKASPLARRLAAEKGISLSSLQGSGPGGRVIAKDVENAQPAAPAASSSKPAPAASAPTQPGLSAGEVRKVPLSGMRRVIADRLLESKTTIPHFYLNIEVDAAPLMKLRAEVKANGAEFGLDKVTVNDFVLRAAALAARQVPKVNASFAGDAVQEFGSVNLAVAVAVEDGLVTPVLRNAHMLPLGEISSTVKDLAGRARSKRLKPEEYQGGTLTVSNLGAYGIDSFYAIINPPQSIILAIGAVTKKPIVNEKDEIVVGQRMQVSLSCDHRVVDGAVGAEYLAAFRKLIETPALLLI